MFIIWSNKTETTRIPPSLSHRAVRSRRAGHRGQIERYSVEMCLFVSFIWTGHVFQNTRTHRAAVLRKVFPMQVITCVLRHGARANKGNAASGKYLTNICCVYLSKSQSGNAWI